MSELDSEIKLNRITAFVLGAPLFLLGIVFLLLTTFLLWKLLLKFENTALWLSLIFLGVGVFFSTVGYRLMSNIVVNGGRLVPRSFLIFLGCLFVVLAIAVGFYVPSNGSFKDKVTIYYLLFANLLLASINFYAAFSSKSYPTKE